MLPICALLKKGGGGEEESHLFWISGGEKGKGRSYPSSGRSGEGKGGKKAPLRFVKRGTFDFPPFWRRNP